MKKSEFKIPKNGQLYVDDVFTRAKKLISTNVWEGIEQRRLDAWQANFKGEIAQYFAACILDSLTYRSERQTVALMQEIFTYRLPQIFRSDPKYSALNIDIIKYMEGYDYANPRKIVLSPVIRNVDPPTKSGPLIARMLKRHLRFSEDLMHWPWTVPKLINNDPNLVVIFVDDLVGSGDQFIEFVKHFSLESQVNSPQCVYAPLAAHYQGINKINIEFPNLIVTTAEKLESDSEFFRQNSDLFHDNFNTTESAREYSNFLLQQIGYPYNKHRRGYGNLSLTYCFHHAIPDNNLPVLWWRKQGSWSPLLDR